MTDTFVFRCTANEKVALRAKAEAAGTSAAHLLREALGLVESRRRKPVPRVDPALTLAVARIGTNLNQIARAVNVAQRSGQLHTLDALSLSHELVAIERQLARITVESRSC